MLQAFNPKNENIKVFIKDKLYDRSEAKVSVFDSTVQGGDAVWEGMRVYNHGVFMLDRHIDRMMASAKAMHFESVPDKNFIYQSIFETLHANEMYHDVHIRLTLSRGEKITSGMDPRLNQAGSTLIVLAEWKAPVYDNDHGIHVVTSHIRRNSPSFLDSKIHHNNLINNILAKISSNIAGADAALMLDAYGFASELNGTNIFMVRNGKMYTPYPDACLHGITRGLVIELAEELGIYCEERNLSLTELYDADEFFATGSMGELTPIKTLDHRIIENKTGSNILGSLIKAFETKIEPYSVKIPKV